MKFGSIFCYNTDNLGDDILSYAAIRQLPQCDYYISRENLDEFCSKEGEQVAVILNGWYLREHYNWPPSPFITPLLVGFHLGTYYARLEGKTTVENHMLEGAGGQFILKNGPIGCRDYHTLQLMKNAKIDGYFSGCLTLTLNKFKNIPKEDYICLVDVPEAIADEIQSQTQCPVKIMTHGIKMWELPIEKRIQKVEEYLKIYQGAKCVITTRLHCALPCLALETPVFLIYEQYMKDRIETYLPFLNHIEWGSAETIKPYFDWENPTPNPNKYLTLRDSLVKRCQCFVDSVQNVPSPIRIELYQAMYAHVDTLKGLRWAEHQQLEQALQREAGLIEQLKQQGCQEEQVISLTEQLNQLGACKDQLEEQFRQIGVDSNCLVQQNSSMQKTLKLMQSELDAGRDDLEKLSKLNLWERVSVLIKAMQEIERRAGARKK